MTPVTYLKLTMDLFQDKTLCDTQRHILGLAKSFNSTGLKLSNQHLAKLFGKNANYIGDLISDLHRREYIEVKNRQSKYRIIYLQKKLEVKENLLPEKTGLLPDISGSTSRETCNITKRSKIRRVRAPKKKAFVIPTLAEVESYIAEKKLSVSGRKFLEYFTESNWIDSRGNKVRNWKQKLLTWDNHTKPGGNGGNGEKPFELPSPDTRGILSRKGWSGDKIDEFIAAGNSL